MGLQEVTLAEGEGLAGAAEAARAAAAEADARVRAQAAEARLAGPGRQAACDARAQRKLGGVALARLDAGGAVRAYTVGLRRAPGPGVPGGDGGAARGRLLYARAQARLLLGEPLAAAEDCSLAVRCFAQWPGCPPRALARAHARRAVARSLLGEYAAALEDLEAAAKLDPEDSLLAELLDDTRGVVLQEMEAGGSVPESPMPRALAGLRAASSSPQQCRESLAGMFRALQPPPAEPTGGAPEEGETAEAGAARVQAVWTLLAAGGLRDVIASFGSDNFGVLRVLAKAAEASAVVRSTLGGDPEAAKVICKAVEGRRVGNIGLGLELAQLTLGHSPHLRALLSQPSGGMVATLAKIAAGGAPGLHGRAVKLLVALYPARGPGASRGELRVLRSCTGELSRAAARALAAPDPSLREAGLRLLASAVGRLGLATPTPAPAGTSRAEAGGSPLASPELAAGLLRLVRTELEPAPAIRTQGTGAAEMVYRRTGDLKPRARARVLRALNLMAEVGRKNPKFCVELDRLRCWNVVLPLLTETGKVAPSPPSPAPAVGSFEGSPGGGGDGGDGSPGSPESSVVQGFEAHEQSLAGGTLALLHAVVRIKPTMAKMLVAVDGALSQVLELLFETSAGGRPCGRKAAADVVAELAGDLEFHKLLYSALDGGPMRFARLVNACEPDAVVGCAALVLQHAIRFDDACMEWLAERPEAAKRIVEQWYQRSGPAKLRITQLMAAALANDAVAGALNAQCSEGQAERLTADLQQFIAMAKARRTGGASLQGPDDPMAGANAAKAAETEGLDARKLAAYILTLLPDNGAGEETGAVVDVCGGDGGMSLALAEGMDASGVHVYTAEWSRTAVDNLAGLAKDRGSQNVFPTLCEFETLSGVPRGDLGAAVMACLWARVEDPPQLLRAVAERLAPGGFLCLLERSPSELQDARDWAERSGFAPFSTPNLFEKHNIEILRLK